MKNFFLDIKDLDDCTNHELLEYILAHVPQLVTQAWYVCLKKMLEFAPNDDRIDSIYETALNIKLRLK